MRDGAGRGRAVWQHLTALVVVPLLATAGLGTGAVLVRRDEVVRAEAAEDLLVTSVQVDDLRRAVDQELLPSLTLLVAHDDETAQRVGLDEGDVRTKLLLDGPGTLATARGATDQALAAATEPGAERAATAVRARLRVARAATDQRSVSAGLLTATYLQISDALVVAEQSAAVRAGSAGLSARSAPAVNDVSLVMELTGLASRQLPLTFAASITTGAEHDRALASWQATTGSYSRLAALSGSLSTPALRGAWSEAVNGPGIAGLSAALTATSSGVPGSPGALPPSTLLQLRQQSATRDAALTRLLQVAADGAVSAAAADRTSSERALAATAAGCLLVLVLAAATTGMVARRLTRSLRQLSAAARTAQEGVPVSVARRGPREVRDIAAALEQTAAGLHRVRRQAEAVTRGDLGAALGMAPVPGRLGEVVHTSVEAMVRAVEARDALRAELAHRAGHDPLTGLPNRATVLGVIGTAVRRVAAGAGPGSGAGGSRAPRGGRPAVLFVDLDGFKRVNDTLGHAAGDAVLREVATRLRSQVRPDDVVARLGGDEFVIVVESVTAADAVALGQRVVEAVSAPLPLDAGGGAVREPVLGASVGVALAGSATGPEQLLAEADTAVYRAKALGRGRVVVFDDALRRAVAAREELLGDLREALASGSLEVRWEPVAQATTGWLVAWHAVPHRPWPGGEALTGVALADAAEEAGLGRELGSWLLGAGTAQLARWRAGALAGSGGSAEPVVAVALTDGHCADPRVLDDVAHALVQADLPPEALVVTVSERALSADPAVAAHLAALRAIGVGVAASGTGTTAVQELPHLPVRSFSLSPDLITSEDPHRQRAAALLAAAARELGLAVVAAGVSTPEQLRRAVAAGATSVRGPLVGDPVTARAAEDLPLPLLGAGRPAAASTAASTAVSTAVSARGPR